MNLLDVVIVGTGGAGKGMHWHLNDPAATVTTPDGTRYRPVVSGYLDDRTEFHGTEIHGVPVLGGIDWCEQHPGQAVVLGLGSPKARMAVVNRLANTGAVYPSFVSPDARVAMGTTIGIGCFVYSGTIINVDCRLGDFCYLNMNTTVGHDVTLGDYTVGYPGATISGNVDVGRGVLLGANSTIVQGLTIGVNVTVGAMACVTRDVTAGATVVGIPAVPIRPAHER